MERGRGGGGRLGIELGTDKFNESVVMTCTSNKRRRVAKRSLNALGGVSGLCGFVNNDEKMKEIELNLKFADSLESIKAAEKMHKREKAVAKHKAHYEKAQKRFSCLRPKSLPKAIPRILP